MVFNNTWNFNDEKTQLVDDNISKINQIIFYSTLIIVGIATLISLAAVVVGIFFLKVNYFKKRFQNRNKGLRSSRTIAMCNEYDEDSTYVKPRSILTGPSPPSFEKYSHYTVAIPSDNFLQDQSIEEDKLFSLNSNRTSQRMSIIFNTRNDEGQTCSNPNYSSESIEISKSPTNRADSLTTNITNKELQSCSSSEDSDNEYDRMFRYNKLFQKTQKININNTNNHIYEEILLPKNQLFRQYPFL